jgi:hypothetical protein
MKKGEEVIIKLSKKLTEIKLEQLSGREGVIDEVVTNEKNQIKGCWVVLTGDPYDNEKEWFIPIDSIELQ